MKKIILLGILSVMCFSLIGCGMYFGFSDSITCEAYANSDQYTAGDFTYSAADVTVIEVSWRIGKVTLVESGAATLSVTESGKNLEPDAQVQHWLENGTLHIQFCQPGRIDVDDKDKHLTLELPKSITLMVQSTSADISADTLEQRSVTLSTVSGDVEAGALAAGEVDISSTSGRQSLGSITADKVNLSSVSGELSVGQATVRGEISCSATSGAIRFEGLKANAADMGTVSGAVELGVLRCPSTLVDTTSGRVSLTLPANTGASVEYSSTSGDLRTSLPWTANGDLMVFGDGGYQICVGTVSGDLEITEETR